MKDAQVGFNTNVVYKGQTLHIQTEDSGRGRPHVITHLYLGGTILATKRISYEPVEGEVNLNERVRGLMKAQHKTMILELRAGVHDGAVLRMIETGAVEPPGQAASADAPAVPEPAGPDESRAAVPPPQPTPWPDLDAPAAPAAGRSPAADPAEESRPPAPTVRAIPPVDPAEASRLPTPPERVAALPSRARAAHSYRPPAPGQGQPDVVDLPRDGEHAERAAAVGRGRRAGPLRPAARREREGFGKDLISDRSLDEVVLSYLAEELTKEEK